MVVENVVVSQANCKPPYRLSFVAFLGGGGV
jgi:hypothetical protein